MAEFTVKFSIKVKSGKSKQVIAFDWWHFSKVILTGDDLIKPTELNQHWCTNAALKV